MSSATREALRARVLATASPKPMPVDVPEWGDVYVRPLLVGDVETKTEGADPKLETARHVARLLCDVNGDLLFDVNSAEDLFAINRLKASSLALIYNAVEKVAPTTAEGLEALGNGSPPATDSSST